MPESGGKRYIFYPAEQLLKLLENVGYMNQMLALFWEIKIGLRAIVSQPLHIHSE